MDYTPLFMAYYANNMHTDLFENLQEISVFDNEMVLKFCFGQSIYKRTEGLHHFSMIDYTQEEIDSLIKSYDDLMKNDAESDFEILYLDKMGTFIKKEIYKEPKFVKKAVQLCDYGMTGYGLNVLVYKLSFNGMETIEKEDKEL